MAELKKMAEKSSKKVNDLRSGKANEIAKLNECLERYKAELDSASKKMNEALANGDNAKYMQALTEQRTAQDNIHFSQDRIALLNKQSVDDRTAEAEINALADEIDKASRKELSSVVDELNKILIRIKDFIQDTDVADRTIVEWASACGTDYPSNSIPYCPAKHELKGLLNEFDSPSGFDGKSIMQKYAEIVKA